MDIKKNILYSSDKKKAVGNIEVDASKMQFDPFYLDSLLPSEPEFSNQTSNKDWKLKVNFEPQALIEIRTFEDLTMKLRKIEKGTII